MRNKNFLGNLFKRHLSKCVQPWIRGPHYTHYTNDFNGFLIITFPESQKKDLTIDTWIIKNPFLCFGALSIFSGANSRFLSERVTK